MRRLKFNAPPPKRKAQAEKLKLNKVTRKKIEVFKFLQE